MASKKRKNSLFRGDNREFHRRDDARDAADAVEQVVLAALGQRRHRAALHAARRPRRDLGHGERAVVGAGDQRLVLDVLEAVEDAEIVLVETDKLN